VLAAAPQLGQKRAPSGSAVPQLAQPRASAAPHDVQKRAPGGDVFAQAEQVAADAVATSRLLRAEIARDRGASVRRWPRDLGDPSSLSGRDGLRPRNPR
jgi:hypothetical protein